MHFHLSDEQKDIQKAADEFARGEFDPDLALELDQAGQFPEAIWRKACSLGFIGMHYPEAYGGQGLGLVECGLVAEAFCRVDSGIGCALASVDRGAEILLRFGSPEQQERFLAPLAKGEKRLTVAFAESEDGKDLPAISTIAEKRNDGYLVRGKKKFVSNVSLADTTILLCKDPEDGLVTLLLAGDPLTNVIPIERMGLRTIPCGDLLLNGIQIPVSERIGREGEGAVHAQYCSQMVGLRTLPQALGVAQGAFDRAFQYSNQREQFGRKLSQFQILRHKLAEMAVSIQVMRFSTYSLASQHDQGKVDETFLDMAQLEAGRRIVGVVDEAVQIFGGYGYMAEQAVEHYFRDAWALATELGTEEDHGDEIARRIIGGT